MRPALALRPIALRAGSARGALALQARAYSAADTSTHPDTPRNLPMTWTDYFAMRKSRKLWSTLSTIPSSIAGLFGGAAYFANLDIDPTQTILGLDPMMVYGGAT